MIDIGTMRLRAGRMVGIDSSIAHNSSWFDKEGRKLGWGDLGQRDLFEIQELLPNGEVFYVLSEADTFNYDDENRDLGYIKSKARYTITKTEVTYRYKSREPVVFKTIQDWRDYLGPARRGDW